MFGGNVRVPFNHEQVLVHSLTIERQFWRKRRPPLKLRDKIREGQRIEGSTIELFYSRPLFEGRGRWIEEPIVRTRFFPRLGIWKIYWQRADLRWHLYKPAPEAESLSEVLRIVDEDEYCCFFG